MRGERLHSVYIIKARRAHRGLKMQTLPLSGFVCVSVTLTLTDTVTLSLIHHSLAVPLTKSELSLCMVRDKL